MNDPGDEHVDAPPIPEDPILAMLIEFGEPVPHAWFVWSGYAEYMRLCCKDCAKEVDSEDGS